MDDLHKKGAAHFGRKFATSFSVSNVRGIPHDKDQLRLMVAVIADGHFRSANTLKVTIRLKKERKILRLRSLLAKAGVSYIERPCGGQPDYQVFRFNAPWNSKYFDDMWWQASQEQLFAIADELPRWDGSERKANGASFTSTVKASSDFAQYAFAATGNTASLTHTARADKSDTYDVHVSRGKEFAGPGRVSSVRLEPNPEGYKYCFTMPSTYWLARHNGHIFATGNTGKTRVQIELFAARRAAGGGAALVVAPKSLLRSAWEDDFKKFAPHITVSVATAEKREQAFAVPADVYVINTDGVNWLVKQDAKFFKRFDTLIIDELSAFKHHTSGRSKAMNKVKKRFKFRYGLTGTPNSNTITDLWHQMFILDDGQRLGTSFYQFRNSTQTPEQVGPQANMLKWTDKPGAEIAVGGMIQDMVVRHKFEECIDIPANHEYSVPYHMTPKQAKLYQQFEKNAVAALSSGKVISALNAAGVMTKLLQIASGASYSEGLEGEDYVSIDTARYELVADLADQRDHSVVFFNWQHQKEHLIEEFKKKGLTYAVIDGSTSDKQRKEAVDLFQQGFYRVLLAHPQSAAHGLTLTKGTATIWASPTYNLEHWLQGNRRIYRAGQTQKTETIVVLAPGTVEDKVFQKLSDKNVRQSNMLSFLQEMFDDYK